MNKFLLGGLAALALVAGVAPASAQTVEFTVINNSSVDLHYFYTSPSNDDSWDMTCSVIPAFSKPVTRRPPPSATVPTSASTTSSS